MDELKSINKLDLYSIPDLCDKNYFIPNYQRGYRWGNVQVRQLLEDLFAYVYDENAKSGFYCLQPVVVRIMSDKEVESQGLKSDLDGNRWYEVIDGQQRLTTIRIILAIEGEFVRFKRRRFNIEYQTRRELGAIYDDLQISEDSISHEFKVGTPQGGKYGDIDSWHVVECASLILKWFQGGRGAGSGNELEKFAGRFYETFIGEKSAPRSVQVIWYQLNDGSDPYEVFKRLNDKKVSLNNAELIRGMFLSDSATFKMDAGLLSQFDEEIRAVVENMEQARKQSHIIEQWDIIENHLRNGQFWSFVKSDNDTAKYSCRIEYIFDLISQKDDRERDELYTYLDFNDRYNRECAGDLWQLWLKVESYYMRLKSWFEDFDYFHKIGYLVAVNGTRALIEILDKSERMTKTAFNNFIEDKIKESITDRTDPEGERCILDYSYDSDYELLKRVLFLYNVESTRQLAHDPFPFEKYKGVKDWTLEHIHAQNSEQIDRSDKDKWDTWFRENQASLELLRQCRPDDHVLANVANEVKSEYERFRQSMARYNYRDLTRVFELVLAYFNELCREEDRVRPVHDISNIALLDGRNNSAISNSVFEVKRQMILNSDAKGDYIPICTRNVFLKYYNRKDPDFTVQQNFYWSENDRQNYRADISEVMQTYLYPGRRSEESSAGSSEEQTEVAEV